MFRFVSGFLVALLCSLLPGLAQAQIQRLPAPPSDTSFGVSVALSGDGRALVGASGANVCGQNSGAVYVFEEDRHGAWERVSRLTPSDCEAGAFFGRSIALSGGRALVGASKEFFADERPNVAYVFERDETTSQWHEADRLTVDPRRAEGTFAASVALDGRRALVTARGGLSSEETAPRTSASASAPPQAASGAAYVFERDARTGRWQRAARLVPRHPDPHRTFGGVGALDGDRLVVTASPYFSDRAGAVYVFERRPSNASPAGEASERGRDGDTARWTQTARLKGFDDFSIPVSLDGDRLLVGESRAGRRHEGAAVLFERAPGGDWEERARLHPKTPYRDGAFGTAVSLSGGRALVTGYDEQLGLGFNIDRVAYVFGQRGDQWRQQQILDMGDVSFGTAIDHHGRTALVGHVPDHGPGAAYIIGLH